jgi:hypothetical protein
LPKGFQVYGRPYRDFTILWYVKPGDIKTLRVSKRNRVLARIIFKRAKKHVATTMTVVSGKYF